MTFDLIGNISSMVAAIIAVGGVFVWLIVYANRYKVSLKYKIPFKNLLGRCSFDNEELYTLGELFAKYASDRQNPDHHRDIVQQQIWVSRGGVWNVTNLIDERYEAGIRKLVDRGILRYDGSLQNFVRFDDYLNYFRIV